MADEAVEQPKDLDVAEYIRSRNEKAAALKAGKEPPPLPKEAIIATEEPTEKRLSSRRDRRTQYRLREEIGVLKGRLAAMEELGIKPAEKAKPADLDPEPLRGNFATDAEFQREVGRWDTRQELKKDNAKRDEAQKTTKQLETERDHLKAMDAKASLDIKTLPDWEKWAEKANSEESIQFIPDEHPTFMGLLASSELRAVVLYHFAQHQEDLQAILDLTSDPGAQIRAFARLEGRIEKMYTSEQKKEVAQASDESKDKSKERATHPADVDKTTGRNASERDAQKPRPTSEVSARGGSAPPEEPEVGSKAWMDRRNAMQYGNRS